MKQFIADIINDKSSGLGAELLKPVLYFLSLVYGFLVDLRLKLFEFRLLKSYHLTLPVISVGNITWGGTGKTPCVEYIAQLLLKKNKRVVILSRGYSESKYDESDSDEGKVFKRNLPSVPVLLGKDRVKNAVAFLIQNHADYFILDDGFQQVGIKKNLDICLVDALNPFGNGWLIPRGILRERLNHLRRCDYVIITKTNFVNGAENIKMIEEKILSYYPQCHIAHAVHKPVNIVNIDSDREVLLDQIKGEKVCLLSGIADPDSFEQNIRTFGVNIENHFRYIDHHQFTKQEMIQCKDYCEKNQIKYLMMTQKDAVRINGELLEIMKKVTMCYLKMSFVIVKGEDHFIETLYSLS